MNTIFKATNVSKKYGTSYALLDINMEIKPGEIYGIVGENGAGKTTLMNIIGGLIRPTAGEISLFETSDKKELQRARRDIGVLIEMPALYPDMNAKENLTFYCRLYRLEDKNSVDDVLKLVSLYDVANKKISEYSLGMRQRLGLAIALIGNPKFLVLDEPINGLDPLGIVEVRKILEFLAKEKKVAILISSHILSELQLLVTKIGFIHKGQLIQEITIDDMLESVETRICIITSHPELAVQTLKTELQLESITVNESGEVQIPKDGVDMEQLMSILFRHGVPIQGVHLSATNLENYYIELIGESKS